MSNFCCLPGIAGGGSLWTRCSPIRKLIISASRKASPILKAAASNSSASPSRRRARQAGWQRGRRNQQTDEILAEFGFGRDEIGKLRQNKVV